jgi:hypothetical protein
LLHRAAGGDQEALRTLFDGNRDRLERMVHLRLNRRYMPPEAFQGRADARGDVYALGLTLYELIVFRPAFDARGRARLVRQVTEATPSRLGAPGAG